MAATVEIDEANTGSETLTHGITNSNLGNTDAVNLVAANYPITPGQNSYEKYQKIHVTAMGGSSKVKTLKIWKTTALSGSDAHKTNARETSYAGAETYSTPIITTSTRATQTMPTTESSGANIGIGGLLTGEWDYVDPELFLSIVTSSYGTSLKHFGEEGIFHQFKEIDHHTIFTTLLF